MTTPSSPRAKARRRQAAHSACLLQPLTSRVTTHRTARPAAPTRPTYTITSRSTQKATAVEPALAGSFLLALSMRATGWRGIAATDRLGGGLRAAGCPSCDPFANLNNIYIYNGVLGASGRPGHTVPRHRGPEARRPPRATTVADIAVAREGIALKGDPRAWFERVTEAASVQRPPQAPVPR